MSRKSLILTLIIVTSLVGTSGTALAFLLRYEPAFYVRGAIPAGERRTNASQECIAQFSTILNGIINNRDGGSATFTEEQLNSYFQEDFIFNHSSENPLPDGISDLRVGFDPNRLRLAFRYGKGKFSSVISIAVKPWIVPREANAVALEFDSLHAGAVPISAQWLLERVYEFARQQDSDASWYRFNGHPVVVLRFQAKRPHPTFQLLSLRLHQGALTISGRSIEGIASTGRSQQSPE